MELRVIVFIGSQEPMHLTVPVLEDDSAGTVERWLFDHMRGGHHGRVITGPGQVRLRPLQPLGSQIPRPGALEAEVLRSNHERIVALTEGLQVHEASQLKVNRVLEYLKLQQLPPPGPVDEAVAAVLDQRFSRLLDSIETYLASLATVPPDEADAQNSASTEPVRLMRLVGDEPVPLGTVSIVVRSMDLVEDVEMRIFLVLLAGGQVFEIDGETWEVGEASQVRLRTDTMVKLAMADPAPRPRDFVAVLYKGFQDRIEDLFDQLPSTVQERPEVQDAKQLLVDISRGDDGHDQLLSRLMDAFEMFFDAQEGLRGPNDGRQDRALATLGDLLQHFKERPDILVERLREMQRHRSR